MKTRILAAVVLLPALFAIVFVAPIIVFGVFMGALTAIATVEFFNCTKVDDGGHIKYVVAAISAIIPIGEALGYGANAQHVCLLILMVYLFSELMYSFKNEKPMPYEVMCVGMVSGYAISYLLTSLVRLGVMGNAFVALPFLIAFSSDSGAYFVGVSMGKHRLSPRLSPKKSIEGSIGGFVITAVILVVYGIFLRNYGYDVSLVVLAVYAVLGSLACQFGDLSFSAVKRICGIKDYGNIIPGHGGILDRFDGMIFVAALVELMVKLFPAF